MLSFNDFVFLVLMQLLALGAVVLGICLAPMTLLLWALAIIAVVFQLLNLSNLMLVRYARGPRLAVAAAAWTPLNLTTLTAVLSFAVVCYLKIML